MKYYFYIIIIHIYMLNLYEITIFNIAKIVM